MNERDVIPALRWKPGRSSGKLSLWGSCHLLWSELPPFKGFWTHASRFQEAEISASLPPHGAHSLPMDPLSKTQRRSPPPATLGQPGLCFALARQP